MLLAVPVKDIQEINRNLEITEIPHAPATVRGVVNLRGHVVTVLNLHNILGLDAVAKSAQSRNLIVQSQNEVIGLWVDRIEDTVNVEESQIDPQPANVPGVDAKFYEGVFLQDTEIAIVVRLDQLLANELQPVQ
jgi:purine-binding chemotaxis protein CheW